MDSKGSPQAFNVAEQPDAQIVEVVIEQFFQTGAGDVRELDFSFFGGKRDLAAFEDIFLP